MTAFKLHKTVMFNHCDPAGIVFYPRYFEMINEVVETWFKDVLNWSFARIHADDNSAVPTVHIETDFISPSRLDDALQFELKVSKVGRSSVALNILCICRNEQRMRAALTLVHVDGHTLTPTPWPESIKTRMNAEKEKTSNAS